MPLTVNPIAVALIFAFVAVVLLARFIRRSPRSGASGPSDPTVVWMNSDVGRRADTEPDRPAKKGTVSADAARDDPGTPDAGTDSGGGGSGDSGGGGGGSSD